MSHSSYKVTVRCRYTLFSCCHNTHMSTHTWSAARCIHCTSCIYENIHQSFVDTLFVNLLSSRNYHNTYIFVYFMTFENCCCLSHVFHTSIRTGSNNNLIDLDRLHSLDLIDRFCVSRKMWECNGWTDFCKIDLNDLLIFSVLIGFIDCIFFLCMLIQILDCLVVYREDSVLCTCLDCHVRHCKTIVHRQIGNSVSGKFHRFVKGTVYTNLSNDVNDNIFTTYILARFSS